MRHFIKTITACILISCSLQATAQSQEEMQKWMEYMTPAEVQKMMASWDGEWTEEVLMWMAPGAPEQKMEASCTNKMILGGRYQEAKHTGNFQGMPFEGLGTLAWDNAAKKFVNTWIDNFGTGMLYMEGTWDAATKTIHLKGSMTDPMTGKPVAIREEMKVIDDNTQQVVQYTEKDGKEFKSMQITLTRKK
jgi:hypothetical protein